MLEPQDIETTTVAGASLEVQFGAPVSSCRKVSGRIEVALPLSVLGDRGVEQIASVPDSEVVDVGEFFVGKGERSTFGACVLPVTPRSLRQTTEEVYAAIFKAIGGQKLYRVWNYVPAINDASSGLENYRIFNVGRSEAFADHFGGEASWEFMPAASAVGNTDDHLAVLFLAGEDPVTYFENPEQVPAYRYPAQYGPKSPSFSRGAKIEGGSIQRAYISGTASIRGHQVVGRSDLHSQLTTTIDNLRLVANAMGASLDDGSASGFFKTYVRNRSDFPAVRDHLFKHIAKEDEAVFLHTDICRAELDIEIEAKLVI